MSKYVRPIITIPLMSVSFIMSYYYYMFDKFKVLEKYTIISGKKFKQDNKKPFYIRSTSQKKVQYYPNNMIFYTKKQLTSEVLLVPNFDFKSNVADCIDSNYDSNYYEINIPDNATIFTSNPYNLSYPSKIYNKSSFMYNYNKYNFMQIDKFEVIKAIKIDDIVTWDENFCETLISKNASNLKYVPENFKTSKMCLHAIQSYNF